MFIYLNKKAQSTAEYVIVLGLVVGAIIAMQTYVKRGLQARVQEATDFKHDPEAATRTGGSIFKTGQYEPYYLHSDFNTTRNSTLEEDVEIGGNAEKDVTENTKRKGSQTIDDTTNRGWN